MSFAAAIRTQFWWECSLEDAGKVIWDYVEYLRDKQSEVRQTDWMHHVLFNNMSLYTHRFAPAAQWMGIDPVNLNIVRNMVNSVHAKVTKSRPAVKVTPVDVNWDLKLLSDNLTRYTNTRISQEFRHVAPEVFRDACIYGTGCIRWVNLYGQETPERVPKREILVDDREARYGKPHQLHLYRRYNRSVLLARFADVDGAESAILSAPVASDDEYWDRDFRTDNTDDIALVESWFKNPDPREPGKYAVTINGQCIILEDWQKQRFPFQFIHWTPPERGFWGTGLPAELASVQATIDYIVNIINTSLRRNAKLNILVPRNAKLNIDHLNNEIGNILEFSGGQPPQWANPDPVSDQVLRILDWWYAKAFEITGISRLEATSQKPAGLESAVALQEYQDINTERFNAVAKAYQEMFPEAGHQIIDLRKTIELDSDDAPDWSERTIVDNIDWKKLDDSRTQFSLILEESNYLPETRAGKLQFAKELASIGVINAKTLSGLFANPDIARFNRLNLASDNNIDRILQELSKEDLESLPEVEGLHDLAGMFEKVQAQFNSFQAYGAPEVILQNHRDFAALIQMEIKRAAPPQPEQPALPPGPEAAAPPGAPPMPGLPMAA